jgi:hypothetical protein
MFKTIAGLLALLTSGEAWSQTRPLTTTMACAQAARLVATQKATVLSTGPYIYDRYVSGGGSCSIGEFPDPAWVPAVDNPQCFIGYRCRGRAQQSSR